MLNGHSHINFQEPICCVGKTGMSTVPPRVWSHYSGMLQKAKVEPSLKLAAGVGALERKEWVAIKHESRTSPLTVCRL